MNIYRDLLRDTWDEVSPKVKASHLSGEDFHASCSLDIAGSTNLLGAIISRVVSFPAPRKSAVVYLRVRASPEGEIWERSFPDCQLNSLQCKSPDGYLVDQFGMIAFCFRLKVSNGAIHHHHTDTYLLLGKFRFRLPRFASPKIISHEEPDPHENASRIHVSVYLTAVGHLLTYSGIVRPVKDMS